MNPRTGSRWRIRHLAILVLVSAVVAAMVKEPIYLLILAGAIPAIPAFRGARWVYRDAIRDCLDRAGADVGLDGRERPASGFDRFGACIIAFYAFVILYFLMGLVVLPIIAIILAGSIWFD